MALEKRADRCVARTNSVRGRSRCWAAASSGYSRGAPAPSSAPAVRRNCISTRPHTHAVEAAFDASRRSRWVGEQQGVLSAGRRMHARGDNDRQPAYGTQPRARPHAWLGYHTGGVSSPSAGCVRRRRGRTKSPVRWDTPRRRPSSSRPRISPSTVRGSRAMTSPGGTMRKSQALPSECWLCEATWWPFLRSISLKLPAAVTADELDARSGVLGGELAEQLEAGGHRARGDRPWCGRRGESRTAPAWAIRRRARRALPCAPGPASPGSPPPVARRRRGLFGWRGRCREQPMAPRASRPRTSSTRWTRARPRALWPESSPPNHTARPRQVATSAHRRRGSCGSARRTRTILRA